MGGVGKIQCRDCIYQENIVSFTHGLNTSASGLQCQLCGKFHSIKNLCDNKPLCECGGVLERDNLIFCPKCKSENMKYDMCYIT